MVTGVLIKEIEGSLAKKIPVFRAMPNTAIAIRESMTCLSYAYATPQQAELIHNIFSTLGKVVTIDEKLMDAANVKAWGMRNCLCDEIYAGSISIRGIEIGFDAATASLITQQTVKGAADLYYNAARIPNMKLIK